MKQPLQVLIVEDDPADAERLMLELGRCGDMFRCRRVETKEDFLRALEELPPDLILSDHGVPSFSGFAALDILRQRCPEVPFLFVTGCADQAIMVEMMECGAAGYVDKNHLSDLVPAIRQALAEAEQHACPAPEESIPEPLSLHAGETPVHLATPSHPLWICSSCKKVLDDRDSWEPIEVYLRKHGQATVSLTLCPVCATRGGS